MLNPNIKSKKSSDWHHVTYSRFSTFLRSSQFFNRLLHPYTWRVSRVLCLYGTTMTQTVHINYQKFFKRCTTCPNFDFCRIFRSKIRNSIDKSRILRPEVKLKFNKWPINLKLIVWVFVWDQIEIDVTSLRVSQTTLNFSDEIWWKKLVFWP